MAKSVRTAWVLVFMVCMAVLVSCASDNQKQETQTKAVQTVKKDSVATKGASQKQQPPIIYPGGRTIESRFAPPQGFVREVLAEGSFGSFLRNFPLKPHGSVVKYYDGRVKPLKSYEAVLDIDTGSRDLQQCADAVMRLYAEYLYGKGMYENISFNFVSGFNANYSRWREGYRIIVEGGTSCRWVKRTGTSNDYESFRQYLDMVFSYANTQSLEKQMKPVPVKELMPGDVFIKGSLPGHCVIVVDTAINTDTGEKLFMTAQSYMPAQDIHILKNESSPGISPWYSLNFGETLNTPEWTFSKDQLKRFCLSP